MNHLLQVVGERKVVSLETGHPSVVQALQALDGYDFDFQGRGWWFNTNKGMKLLPNNLGEVLLPAETMSFMVTQVRQQWLRSHEKGRYTMRGRRLYDTILNTHLIGVPVVADLVVQLPVDDLPPVAISYLKHWAGQEFYNDDDGDAQKYQQLRERTGLAWQALKAEELKVLALNALDSPAAMQLTHRIGQYSGQYLTNPGGRIFE